MRWDFGGTHRHAAPSASSATQTPAAPASAATRCRRDGTKIVVVERGRPERRRGLLLCDIANDKPLRAVPLAQQEPVRVLEHRRARSSSASTATTTKTGPVEPDDLRRHDRRGDGDDRPRRAARRSPRLVEELDGATPSPSRRSTAAPAPPTSGRQRAASTSSTTTARHLGRRRRCWCRRTRGRTATTRRSRPTGICVVYDESTCPTGRRPAGSDSTSRATPTPTPTATHVADVAAAAATPIALANANAPGVADKGTTDLTNSFPKWAPFVVRSSTSSSSSSG